MNDFGKILDQWEGASSRGRSGGDLPGERSSEQAAAGEMESWLDKYPPDETVRDDGLSGRATRRVNPERLKVDASVDLHGYRLEEAIVVTDRFIEESVAEGYRKVMIIHGKGDNGQGVLRKEIRTHLEHHPMTGAMGYGRGVDGGRGALWVILRSQRRPE